MLFWQLFTKNSNLILATIYKKPKYYFGNYFQKAQILFWQLLQKAQYYFGIFYQENPKLLDKQLFYQSPNIIWQKNYIMIEVQNYSLEKTYFDILNSLTHGKHKLLMTLLPIFQNYFSYKIYGNYAYFFHKKP